jgi:phosphoadenosine phosphosulfate reductase
MRPVDNSHRLRQSGRAAALLDGLLEATASLEDRIAGITATVGGPVAFSTSLGLEDQAILHAVALTSPGIRIFVLDTGRHFPETLETLARSEQRYGVRIRVVAPDTAEVEHLVARDGVLGFRHSLEARRACCDVRKVRPLRRALAGAAGWITGLRRGQSADRAAVPLAAWDAGLGLVKINPLADWSLERLQDYIERNHIPVNPLHARGFASIGCQTCTRAVAPGEDARAGRWWWELQDGKECGLHDAARRPRPGAGP